MSPCPKERKATRPGDETRTPIVRRKDTEIELGPSESRMPFSRPLFSRVVTLTSAKSMGRDTRPQRPEYVSGSRDFSEWANLVVAARRMAAT